MNEIDKQIIEFSIPLFERYLKDAKAHNIGTPIYYLKFGSDARDNFITDLDFLIFCLKEYKRINWAEERVNKKELFLRKEIKDTISKDFGRILTTAFY